MTEARARGYFGIGVEGVSKPANVGALLRTAHAFGAAFCFSVGAGWDARAARAADTAETPTHVPLWRFPDPEALALPQRCVLVGIELLDEAVALPSFRHPLNAAYVLGPERSGLSPAMLARCRHVVRVPTRFALNLAVAGALVLYDRLLQHGRFAERPVGSGVGSGVASGVGTRMGTTMGATMGSAPGSMMASASGSPSDRPIGSTSASRAAPAMPCVIGSTSASPATPAAPCVAGHGAPRFRRTRPGWLITAADAEK